jgi:nitrite reductase/ring-hydroxylating ferredoxin subunit/uncharacterized membrane protein
MTRLTDVADRAVTAIGGQAWLDKPSYKIEHGVSLVLNLLGPASHPVRKLLHGTPLGHPLHPLLTDLPVGSWTAALVLDLADVLTAERNRLGPAAQVAVAVGVAGAAGAAVTGVTDWQYTEGEGRRIGLVHGVVNATVLTLYTTSLVQRRRGHRGRGRVLSGIGYALLSGSAYLGGMLVYRHRVGVDHSDAELEPREFVAVLAEGDLPDGRPISVEADGVPVVLVRERGGVHGLGARCAHLGGPLGEGFVYRGGIACPWHGSRYDLETGHVLDGPATAPIPCFEARIHAGLVEVRRRPPIPTAPPGAAIARQQGEADARH